MQQELAALKATVQAPQAVSHSNDRDSMALHKLTVSCPVVNHEGRRNLAARKVKRYGLKNQQELHDPVQRNQQKDRCHPSATDAGDRSKRPTTGSFRVPKCPSAGSKGRDGCSEAGPVARARSFVDSQTPCAEVATRTAQQDCGAAQTICAGGGKKRG